MAVTPGNAWGGEAGARLGEGKGGLAAGETGGLAFAEATGEVGKVASLRPGKAPDFEPGLIPSKSPKVFFEAAGGAKTARLCLSGCGGRVGLAGATLPAGAVVILSRDWRILRAVSAARPSRRSISSIRGFSRVVILRLIRASSSSISKLGLLRLATLNLPQMAGCSMVDCRRGDVLGLGCSGRLEVRSIGSGASGGAIAGVTGAVLVVDSASEPNKSLLRKLREPLATSPREASNEGCRGDEGGLCIVGTPRFS